MPDLGPQLNQILRGRVCLVGLGSSDWGDDACGVELAEALGPSERAEAPCLGRLPSSGRPTPESPSRSVVVAGHAPERWVSWLTDAGLDDVLFLDAVDFGGTPGSVAMFDSGQMSARFPQVSTHRLSLGLLARMIEASGRTRVHLLGVQPESMRPGAGLSPAVRATLAALLELLKEPVAGGRRFLKP